MTPRQIEQVRTSFARLAPLGAGLGITFYDTLFRLDPALRPMFPADTSQQAAKLTDMLAAIVEALDHPERLHAMFHALGERHSGYGATEDHYDSIGAALLMTLRQALGTDFDDDLETAWGTIYGDLAEVMIGAGQQAAPRL